MTTCRRFLWFMFFTIYFFAMTVCGVAAADTPNKKESLESDDLSARRAVIENTTELDESTRKTALGLIDQAILYVDQTNKYERDMAEISRNVKDAPLLIKKIQGQLSADKPLSVISDARLKDMSALEIEHQLNQVQADEAQARNTLDQYSAKLDRGERDVTEFPEAIARAGQRLKQVTDESAFPPVKGESGLIADTRKTLYAAEQAKLETEIRMRELYLATHRTLAALVTAQRDLVARDLEKLQGPIKIYQDRLQEKRQQDATLERQTAEEAKQTASLLPQSIQDQLDINIALSGKLESLTRREAELASKMEKTKAQLTELNQEFELAKERVDSLVLTGAAGLALREQRQFLPSENQYRVNSLQRQRSMAKIQEELIDIRRKHRNLVDIDAAAEDIIDAIGSVSPDEKKRLMPDVRDLLVSYKNLLEKLQTGDQRYFKSIRNLEYLDQQLIFRSKEFAAFLDKHLLWIPSSKPLSLSDVGNLAMELKWVAGLKNMKSLTKDFLESIKSSPVIWFFGLVLMGGLLAGRKSTRRYGNDIAAKAGTAATDSMALTFKAFLLLFYESLVWPYIMVFVSLQLSRLPRPADFTLSMSAGLFRAAEITFLMILFSRFCRKNGLAQLHFRWPESVRVTLRRNLSWFAPLLVAMDFVIVTMGTPKLFEYGNVIAKLALMTQGAAMAVFCALIFRFSGGIVGHMISCTPNFWLTRARYVWYPLAVAIPFSHVLLVMFGYYYSAMELRNLIGKTILLFIGLMVLRDLALRALGLLHRNIAAKEGAQEEDAATEASMRRDEADMECILPDEPYIDLAEINEQTRALLKMVLFVLGLAGTVAIWKEPSRAFTVLQDIRLWTYSDMVNGVSQTMPITIGDLIIAALVAAVTVIAARDLPGLLEVTLMRRLNMDSGARYAYITLCRYTIIAVGIIMFVNAVGFNWSKIQWLIAALGVGLGFGLQEIVANFISGLIVLFERPFRIGDTVTIGDIVGTVSRIKFRATTIVDWDRRELIVPNKEFITGRLINWTLSDPIVRIIVPVGIAYGSDTARAEKLLLKAADENPRVLKKPAPVAVFKEFGDNSLNFELRVFISGIEDWIPMLHSLNMAVDREFSAAGVTISFPQRDVHLDTTKPLEFRVVSANREG